MTVGVQQSLGNGIRGEQPLGMLRVLCVGEQSRPLAGEGAQLPRIEPVYVAANMVEAILLSDEHRPWDLIIAAVAQEGAQLERAVQALRVVNMGVKIILLGEPTEEPLCRRAMVAGADDYFVLPTPLSLILQLSGAARTGLMAAGGETFGAQRAVRENGSGQRAAAESAEPLAETEAEPGAVNGVNAGERNSGAKGAAAVRAGSGPSLPGVLNAIGTLRNINVGRAAVPPLAAMRERDSAARMGITLAGLPLVVQTSLLSDILQAKSEISGRLVATLQTYIQWPGILTFVPEGKEEVTPHGVTMTADVAHDGVRFGALHLESAEEESASMLNQAAIWLGSWLAMARRQEQLRLLAITDELSGAYNRRYFTRFVEGLIEKARAQQFRISLLVFDIDDFKRYNDQFGHAAGDAIIRALIKLLRRCTRPSDLVARIGGDEFAVVFWDSEARRQPNSQHPRDAVAATDRFRKAIEAHDWAEDCKIQGQVSISGGIANFPYDALTLESLVVKADEAMLKAKRAGKNVIHIHCAESPETE